MTLRSPELRQAYEAVRKDKAAQRKERKEKAREYIKTQVSSGMANRKDVRERNNGFLAFVRRHPCCACGGSPVDAAHTRFSNPKVGRVNPGMGRKPSDQFATPLCRADHTAQHMRGNEAAWWAEQGLDPDEISTRLFAAFLSGSEPISLEVLRHGTARNASAKERHGLNTKSSLRSQPQ